MTSGGLAISHRKNLIVTRKYYEKKRNTPFSRSNHLVKSVHKYVNMTKEDFNNLTNLDKSEAKNEK